MEILNFNEFLKLDESQQLDENFISNYFKYLFYYKDNYINKYFGKFDLEQFFNVLNSEDFTFYKESILTDLFLFILKNERCFIINVSSETNLPKNKNVTLFKFTISFKYAITKDKSETFRLEGNFRNYYDTLQYDFSLESIKPNIFYKEISDEVEISNYQTSTQRYEMFEKYQGVII